MCSSPINVYKNIFEDKKVLKAGFWMFSSRSDIAKEM